MRKAVGLQQFKPWVIATSFDSHWMDFQCFDVEGEYSYGNKPILSGFIKWDGCYQITQIANIHLHWDNGETLDRFCAMLKHIPVLAKQMESWEGDY